MSATSSSKKRKLDTSSSAKRRHLPSKKFRSNAYHSDSEDEDGQFTARDAPQLEPKAAASNLGQAMKPKASLKTSGNKIVHTGSHKSIQNEEAETQSYTSSDESTAEHDETDDPDLDATADSDISDTDSEDSSNSQSGSTLRPKTKRHDPAAFATSISAILGSSLSRSKRADPVLSRSKDAAEVSKALSDSKLEIKAKKQLVAEKRQAKEKGRVRDVLIGNRTATVEDDDEEVGQVAGVSAAEILAKEKQLRKLAQRGVVKLFNAVRAAQVRGEEEAKKVKAQGVVGISKREEKVSQMSRDAFLDLVGAGGQDR